MRTLLAITTLALALTAAAPASALETMCSNPSRARVLAHMSLSIPEGDEPAFAERMRQFRSRSTMSYAEVDAADGNVWRSRTIIFQSPEVSVVIHVRTRRGSDTARVEIERTCINDALEPWRPFWSDFRRFTEEEFGR